MVSSTSWFRSTPSIYFPPLAVTVKLTETIHDITGILGAGVDHLHVALHLLFVIQVLRVVQQQFTQTQDADESIIEIVGDTAGHAAQRPQALLLNDPLLGVPQLFEHEFQSLLAFAMLGDFDKELVIGYPKLSGFVR